MTEALSSRIAQFEQDLDIAHQIVHGTASETVDTENGPLRTFAKVLDDAIVATSSHFKGLFVDLAALQAAVTEPVPGDYADVDAGVDYEVTRHLWDSSDGVWVAQLGTSTQMTAAQIKAEYESNPNTNPFTDAEKAKLSAIPFEVVNDSNVNLDLGLDHIGTYHRVNSESAATRTVPPQSSVAWPENAEITIEQSGAGSVTIAAGDGVIINHLVGTTLTIYGQYGAVSLKRVAADEWTVIGALVTSS